MSATLVFSALAVLYGAYAVSSATLAGLAGYGAAFLVFALVAAACWARAADDRRRP